MIDLILFVIDRFQVSFWEYVGLPIVVLIGIYLTIRSRGMQFKAMWHCRKHLRALSAVGRYKRLDGVHPFKLFFASVGGMVGIGNIVTVGAAISIGGPGSIFWMWVASFSGMLIKYSEIYLGIKYRVSDNNGSYNGGPMYYIQAAFKNKIWAYLSAFLLCIYGVEIYQFTIIVDRLEGTFHMDRNLVISIVLLLSLYTVVGGVKRMANICSLIMPIFMMSYILICLYIIAVNYVVLPSVLYEIISGAFNGHAPIGGFVGSTAMLTASTGVARGVYAADIGIGYDSVVQSETMVETPKQQARMSIYALFSDTFICMMTTLIFAVTGGWHKLNNAPSENAVSIILSDYLPYSDLFLTCLLFLAGFTTVVAYFSTGMKSASFISKKYGAKIYMIYAVCAFIFFSHYPAESAIGIMLLIAPLLLCLNITAIFKLVKVIEF